MGQLAQEFLESETYRQIKATNPLLSISAEHVQGCSKARGIGAKHAAAGIAAVITVITAYA